MFENSSEALIQPFAPYVFLFAPLRETAFHAGGANKEKPKALRVELWFSRCVRREGTSRDKTS
jgi:hypothetical protein